jgi:hypothetical protein
MVPGAVDVDVADLLAEAVLAEVDVADVTAALVDEDVGGAEVLAEVLDETALEEEDVVGGAEDVMAEEVAGALDDTAEVLADELVVATLLELITDELMTVDELGADEGADELATLVVDGVVVLTIVVDVVLTMVLVGLAVVLMLVETTVVDTTVEELTTEELAADELTTDELTADELTTDELTADELTTEELTAEELTAEELEADELTTDELTADELTIEELTADELTTEELTVTTELDEDALVDDVPDTITVVLEPAPLALELRAVELSEASYLYMVRRLPAPHHVSESPGHKKLQVELVRSGAVLPRSWLSQ